MTDVITVPILVRYSQKDKDIKKVFAAIQEGKKCPERLKDEKLKDCYEEFSVQGDGMVLVGERLPIPRKNCPDVLQAMHMGHAGRESMLKQMWLSVWWPGISKDTKEF